MWVQQFWNGSDNGDTLDTQINQYLDNNPNVEVIDIKFAFCVDRGTEYESALVMLKEAGK
ncbi:hypothetical protein ACLUXD_01910 [Loigolactobacillus coryniformis subsp. coryniformis]|uniref:hypothetical protein n=1 Tax=Loigolactobacillus coryniformis TaxID=1610 RepID=UPI00399582C1